MHCGECAAASGEDADRAHQSFDSYSLSLDVLNILLK